MNLRVGSSREDPYYWHGTKLEDLSENLDSVDSIGQVFPTCFGPKVSQDTRKQTCFEAVQFCEQHETTVFKVLKRHPYVLAFAITDYKVRRRCSRVGERQKE